MPGLRVHEAVDSLAVHHETDAHAGPYGDVGARALAFLLGPPLLVVGATNRDQNSGGDVRGRGGVESASAYMLRQAETKHTAWLLRAYLLL